jgi:hypothetical protein
VIELTNDSDYVYMVLIAAALMTQEFGAAKTRGRSTKTDALGWAAP